MGAIHGFFAVNARIDNSKAIDQWVCRKNQARAASTPTSAMNAPIFVLANQAAKTPTTIAVIQLSDRDNIQPAPAKKASADNVRLTSIPRSRLSIGPWYPHRHEPTALG